MSRAGRVGGAAQPASPTDVGTWCCEFELAGDGRPDAVLPPGVELRRARVLVRLHGEPLGYVSVPMAEQRIDVATLLAEIRARLADSVNEHLVAEGLTPVHRLGPAARPAPAGHACPNRVDRDELVTVVVCTRGRSRILSDCLARLRLLTYHRVEVVVVDNAPTDDDTRRAVNAVTAADERIRYVVEPRPGLSWARNRGLAESRGRYIAYTDDDVAVDPDWLQGLLRGFSRRPDVGCVTGLVCTAGINNAAEAYFDARTSSWSTRCRAEIFDLRSERTADPLYPYSPGIFGTGANFAFDRLLLAALGGFDPALGAGTRSRGGEDLDMFVRVLFAGRAIAYEPAAVVWHHHRADRITLLRQMYGYGTGLSAFVTKHLVHRSTRWQVLRRIPTGLRRMARISSETSSRLGDRSRAPKGTLLREFAGFVTGPLLYARAARAVRRQEAAVS